MERWIEQVSCPHFHGIYTLDSQQWSNNYMFGGCYKEEKQTSIMTSYIIILQYLEATTYKDQAEATAAY